jgi:two-component system LytT family response regulator
MEGIEVIANQHVDIVFSDIDMPELDGIGFLKSLKNPPVFIFITSFADFAAESWNLDVVDFIVKPLKLERLIQAVNKATEYLQLKAIQAENIQKELHTKEQSNIFADDFFFIKESKGITKLRYADVLFIESMGDFSKISTLNNKKHVVLTGLKNLLEQLPLTVFKRVHKQYVVNLDHVHTVSPTDIHFFNDQSVPVSDLYRQETLDAFVKKDVIKRKN